MNLLNCIPFGDKVLDTVTTLIGKSADNKDGTSIKIDEKDLKKGLDALTNAQKSLSKNNSMFVSGAIPSMLWAMVLIIVFNYVIAPLLMGLFNITIPSVALPEWYSSMCSTIVIGLFAKKAWDSADISAGSFVKKSKYDSENTTDIKNVAAKLMALTTAVSAPAKKSTLNEELEALDEIGGTESEVEAEVETDINDPEYVQKRIDELGKKYGITK